MTKSENIKLMLMASMISIVGNNNHVDYKINKQPQSEEAKQEALSKAQAKRDRKANKNDCVHRLHTNSSNALYRSK